MRQAASLAFRVSTKRPPDRNKKDMSLPEDLRNPHFYCCFGGREGIRTPGLLVANEEKSKLRLGATVT
jgi:hypothetical protein